LSMQWINHHNRTRQLIDDECTAGDLLVLHVCYKLSLAQERVAAVHLLRRCVIAVQAPPCR
jgi:hypothetical protein